MSPRDPVRLGGNSICLFRIGDPTVREVDRESPSGFYPYLDLAPPTPRPGMTGGEGDRRSIAEVQRGFTVRTWREGT